MPQLLAPIWKEIFANPQDWHVMVEDFDKEHPLTSDLPVSASSRWIGTQIGAAACTFAQATDEAHGVALFTTAATDNKGLQIQEDMETWSLVAGKRLVFAIRCKFGEVGQQDVFAGVMITDTTGMDGAATLSHADSVGISLADGASSLSVVARTGSASAGSSTILGTAVASTYYWLGFEVWMDAAISARGDVWASVNDSRMHAFTSTTLTAEILAGYVGLTAGEGAAKTLTVDKIMIAQER